MIKINLAKKKQLAAVAGDAGGGGTSLLRLDAQKLELLKELPFGKILGCLILGYAASWSVDFYKGREVGKLEDTVGKMTTENTKLKADLAKTKGFEEVKKTLDSDETTIRTKIEIIMKLLRDRQTSSKILTTLSTSTPADVWLNSFTINGDDIHFDGYALGFNQISDFMKILGESAYFGDLKLATTDQSKDEGGQDVVRFDITAKRR